MWFICETNGAFFLLFPRWMLIVTHWIKLAWVWKPRGTLPTQHCKYLIIVHSIMTCDIQTSPWQIMSAYKENTITSWLWRVSVLFNWELVVGKPYKVFGGPDNFVIGKIEKRKAKVNCGLCSLIPVIIVKPSRGYRRETIKQEEKEKELGKTHTPKGVSRWSAMRPSEARMRECDCQRRTGVVMW